jgi:anti-sigma factor RsiW
MNCSRDLIEAYMDEELEPSARAAVEEHLAACPACSAAHSEFREQRAGIRSAPYYAAPAQLQESVRKALRQAAEQEKPAMAQNNRWRWMAIAASVLLAISVSWNLRKPQNESIAQTIVSDHIRSLQGTHLLDVTSSDQHTVKPWFNGKLDFSPVVKDFAAQGFPLVGGRLDYLSDRTVAALVYERRQHIINVFTWPSAPSSEKEFSRNGYNVVHWQNGAMTCWAVSDLAIAELEQFKELNLK